jgi:hypothetical protein
MFQGSAMNFYKNPTILTKPVIHITNNPVRYDQWCFLMPIHPVFPGICDIGRLAPHTD